MKWIDAHCHYHDARLQPHWPAIEPGLNLAGAVVNGTREEDWPAVSALAQQHAWVRPAFGLHPWHAPARSPRWLEALRAQLDQHPHAGLGEIGLDGWVPGHDLADQTPVFEAQFDLAIERDLPATIHCVQAWGALAAVLRNRPLPARGFLLHAYGGSLEMMREFAGHGAYFSFSPYFLHERKAAQRTVFAQIPGNRLLVETDAPGLRPPDAQNPHPLHDSSGEPLNHPANIELAYRELARIRQTPVEALAGSVAANFDRLFGEGR